MKKLLYLLMCTTAFSVKIDDFIENNIKPCLRENPFFKPAEGAADPIQANQDFNKEIKWLSSCIEQSYAQTMGYSVDQAEESDELESSVQDDMSELGSTTFTEKSTNMKSKISDNKLHFAICMIPLLASQEHKKRSESIRDHFLELLKDNKFKPHQHQLITHTSNIFQKDADKILHNRTQRSIVISLLRYMFSAIEQDIQKEIQKLATEKDSEDQLALKIELKEDIQTYYKKLDKAKHALHMQSKDCHHHNSILDHVKSLSCTNNAAGDVVEGAHEEEAQSVDDRATVVSNLVHERQKTCVIS